LDSRRERRQIVVGHRDTLPDQFGGRDRQIWAQGSMGVSGLVVLPR